MILKKLTWSETDDAPDRRWRKYFFNIFTISTNILRTDIDFKHQQTDFSNPEGSWVF